MSVVCPYFACFLVWELIHFCKMLQVIALNMKPPNQQIFKGEATNKINFDANPCFEILKTSQMNLKLFNGENSVDSIVSIINFMILTILSTI